MCVDDLLKNLFQLFLSYVEVYFKQQLISFRLTVNKAKILRNDLIEDKPAEGRLDRLRLNLSARQSLRHADFDA